MCLGGVFGLYARYDMSVHINGHTTNGSSISNHFKEKELLLLKIKKMVHLIAKIVQNPEVKNSKTVFLASVFDSIGIFSFGIQNSPG
ncbi:hypothetical protein VC82_1933 [Flagellimonas lutaonensis]|uniref:Uncharacterized protein n=1 Tax=Flagellimonas lutaonensis TaxID=516051 RepID=A0A0D5YUL9_9FLAO|nr:hypothetical protein VC82_1933 [Allomuricauda lutaonensis]